MTFCDQRPGNITQLDFTYLACYDRFENMKACFWHNISQEPESIVIITEEQGPQSFLHEEGSFSQDERSSSHDEGSFSQDERPQSFSEQDVTPRRSLRVPGSARTFQAKTFN